MKLGHFEDRPRSTTGARRARFRRLALLASALLATSGVVRAGEPTRSIAIPGDGGWDYAKVDEAARRLYIAHGDTVAVVDLASGRALPPLGPVSHAHAVVPLGTGEVAVTSGADDSVRFFDQTSGRQIARVPVGAKPDAAIVDPVTKHVLSMNSDAGTISDIDPKTHRVVRTIRVAAALEYAVVSGRTLFINNEDRNEIDVVDLVRGAAGTPIALPGCDAPTGLALDAAHHRLISACANGIAAIVDVPSQRLIQRIPVGRGPDAVIVDEARSLAFIPAGQDGVLDVLSLAGPRVEHVKAISTETGARTGALDPRTGIIWLPVAKSLPAVGRARPAAIPGTFHALAVSPA